MRANLASPPAEVRTHASARPPAKPLSRSAALRAARAAHKAATSGEGGVSVEAAGPQLAEVSPLDTDVAAALAAYRSTVLGPAMWARVADVTRLLVAATHPTTGAVARTRASTVAHFAAWVLSRPERDTDAPALAADEVLVPGLVDAYLAGPKADAVGSTRANTQTVLRRALRALSTDPQPPPIPHTPIQAPYTPRECAAYVRVARNQPTSSTRRSLSSVIGLGLGGGLDGQDQRGVTPECCFDVDLGDGVVGLAVRVTGRRARTVVIAGEYEDLVREAIALHFAEKRKVDQPLYGTTTERYNVTSGPRNRAITAKGLGVDVNVASLRTTWLLAAMCADVPLGALLGAAGLQSPRTLVDLLPYCPDPEPEAVDQMLYGLRAQNITPPAPRTVKAKAKPVIGEAAAEGAS